MAAISSKKPSFASAVLTLTMGRHRNPEQRRAEADGGTDATSADKRLKGERRLGATIASQSLKLTMENTALAARFFDADFDGANLRAVEFCFHLAANQLGDMLGQ